MAYQLVLQTTDISIHALREESDDETERNWMRSLAISIHALREESDPVFSSHSSYGVLFQSTLSVRRATGKSGRISAGIGISIHALREESDYSVMVPASRHGISIHALREESDRLPRWIRAGHMHFNPRSP